MAEFSLAATKKERWSDDDITFVYWSAMTPLFSSVGRNRSFASVLTNYIYTVGRSSGHERLLYSSPEIRASCNEEALEVQTLGH